MNQLDVKTQEYLDKVTGIEADQLQEHEKAFLRARVSYLDKKQLKKYASVLKAKPAKPEVAPELDPDTNPFPPKDPTVEEVKKDKKAKK